MEQLLEKVCVEFYFIHMFFEIGFLFFELKLEMKIGVGITSNLLPMDADNVCAI